MSTFANLPVWATIIIIIFSLAIAYFLLRTVLLMIDRAYGSLEDLLIGCYDRLTGRSIRKESAISRAPGNNWAFLEPVIRLLCWPFTQLRDAVQDAISPLVQRMREDEDLRRIWKEEYRDQFRTFKEFKAAFERGGPDSASNSDSGSVSDDELRARSFEEACHKLGLPADGDFSYEEFIRRFREMISAAHPDRHGSNWFASEINKARETIETQKGWP